MDSDVNTRMRSKLKFLMNQGHKEPDQAVLPMPFKSQKETTEPSTDHKKTSNQGPSAHLLPTSPFNFSSNQTPSKQVGFALRQVPMIAEEELVEEELHRYFRRPKKFPFKSRCMDPKLNDKLQDLRESPDPSRRLRAAVIGHNYPCYTPAQVRAYRLNIV